MLLINLFGAPGAGKSTGAAYIFSKLKMAGVNAELVTEFVKDKVWEESKAVFNDQVYILDKQNFRISRCNNKVDVVITDSPIYLSSLYNKDEQIQKELDALIKALSNKYQAINVFVKRVKPYNPIGRFQTESESDELSKDIESLLKRFDISPIKINGDIEGYDELVLTILNLIGLKELRDD